MIRELRKGLLGAAAGGKPLKSTVYKKENYPYIIQMIRIGNCDCYYIYVQIGLIQFGFE